MRHYLFIISILLFFLTTQCYSQSDFTWSQYHPLQKVDSIVLFSVPNAYLKFLTSADSSKMTQKEIDAYYQYQELLSIMINRRLFPLDDCKVCYSLFKKRKTLRKAEEMKNFVKLFPFETCTEFPVYRCLPVYRDCILYFKGGKPIYAIKICFDCHSIESTPTSPEAKCLANDVTFNAIVDEYMKMGLLDMFDRH